MRKNQQKGQKSADAGIKVMVLKKGRCIHGIGVELWHRFEDGMRQIRASCNCRFCKPAFEAFADWVPLPDAA